jgi:hypothetical protein
LASDAKKDNKLRKFHSQVSLLSLFIEIVEFSVRKIEQPSMTFSAAAGVS